MRGDRIPVDIDAMASQLGADVSYQPMTSCLLTMYPMLDGQVVIMVSDTLDHKARRFTCAHELAHLMLLIERRRQDSGH